MIVCLGEHLEFDMDPEVSFLDLAKHLTQPRGGIHFSKKPTNFACHDAVDPRTVRRTVLAQFTTVKGPVSVATRSELSIGRGMRPLTAGEFLYLLEGFRRDLRGVDSPIVILGSDFLDRDAGNGEGCYIIDYNPVTRVFTFHDHDHQWPEGTWLAVALC